jgi:hypothetical protein
MRYTEGSDIVAEIVAQVEGSGAPEFSSLPGPVRRAIERLAKLAGHEDAERAYIAATANDDTDPAEDLDPDAIVDAIRR